jgi:L-rhamnose mutarotase
MKTYCLTLDLHDDPRLIAEYKRYHTSQGFWPELVDHIRSEGILTEQIYLLGNRLVMILQTTDEFSFEAKAAADTANPRMQEWETLMWKYQKPLPHARHGEKWLRMEQIFELDSVRQSEALPDSSGDTVPGRVTRGRATEQFGEEHSD